MRFIRKWRHAPHTDMNTAAPEAIFNIALEVEHIISVSHGGENVDSNLALACRACNLAKSNFQTGFDSTAGTDVRLFHPRLDVWDEHFRFDFGIGTVVGLTPTGRATVARLQMNADFQRDARLLWIRYGLIP
jgi:hypothetical protein